MNTIYSIKNSVKRILRDSNKWSVLTLTIVLFIALPILTIVVNLFDGPGEMWGHVVTHLMGSYVSNSLKLIVGCSFLTLLFGVSSAWFVSRYQFPFRRIFEWLLILPLAIPSYITAYAYAGIFDHSGTLQQLFQNIGIDFPRIDVMNSLGLIGVLSISLFPYIYVSARAVFLHQSSTLIEASKLLGASEIKTFFKIVLPLARPAIIGGLVLVLMEVLNDYGAAKYYGVSTFTTGIFRSWFALEEPETAIFLSAILVVFIFALIAIEKWQRKRIGYADSPKPRKAIKSITLFGYKKYLVILAILIPVLFGFVIPVLQLLYWSFLTFESVFSTDFITVALQSIGIALVTALATTVTAFFFIYFVKWNKLRAVTFISKVTTVGYAIPGAVIAIGIMIPTLALDKELIAFFKSNFDLSIGLLINGTVIALIYAYVVRFLAVAYNPIEASSLKIGNHLSESSKLLGKSAFKTLLKIELPLLKTGFISAFILVFIDVMKELPLTLILKPYHIQTLAVKAYEYAGDERIAESALPSLLIVSIGVFFVLFLNKIIRKK